MSACFFTLTNQKEFTRDKANGYKRLLISDKIESPCMATIVSENVDSDLPLLVVQPDYSQDTEPDKYLFLCKSIGLVGYSASFDNKISVIFCDDEWMLVTLTKGVLVLQENEDTLKVFSVGVENVPMIERDNILWYNSKDLMSLIRYTGVKSTFPFDFEFMFKLGEGIPVTTENCYLKHIDSEDIDISMGAFAILSDSVNTEEIQETEKKEKIKEKNKRNLDRYFA